MDEEGSYSDNDSAASYTPPSATAAGSSSDVDADDRYDLDFDYDNGDGDGDGISVVDLCDNEGKNGSNDIARVATATITPEKERIVTDKSDEKEERKRKAAAAQRQTRSAVRSRLQLTVDSDDDGDNSPTSEVAGASVRNSDDDDGDGEARVNRGLFVEALDSLTWLEKVSADEAGVALEAVGPPYGLQNAALELQNMKDRALQQSRSLLAVEVGMKIRKSFGGKQYHGEVVKEVKEHRWRQGRHGAPGRYVKAWKVRYEEDGDEEELEWDEIYRCRDDRPRFPAPCRGRPLHCLELFCGKAVVAQEFCDRKWKTASMDINKDSNATIKTDIRKVKEKDLPFVPDFIWASPPCNTYSNMAGGAHRTVSAGLLDKSPMAREHNFFFTRMAEIMIWAKERHPHLIVVIENPVGLLKSMPLMQAFSKQFGLLSTTVNYCAFGRDEMKPTILWTNDWGLRATLSEYTCAARCPHGGRGTHPIGVRQGSCEYDFSVIPQPLAEEVASYVDAKFYMDRIRFEDAALPSDVAVSRTFREISEQNIRSWSTSPAATSEAGLPLLPCHSGPRLIVAHRGSDSAANWR